MSVLHAVVAAHFRAYLLTPSSPLIFIHSFSQHVFVQFTFTISPQEAGQATASKLCKDQQL